MDIELEDVVSQLRPYLTDYLQRQGINIAKNKNICCINPEHNDSTPSMMLLSDESRVSCFGCGAKPDIFGAANYLEGKPLSGPEFIEDNVNYLARMFGVAPYEKEVSDQDLHRIETLRTNAKVVAVAMEPGISDFTHAQSRGWEEESARDMGVFTIKDTVRFKEKLAEQGVDQETLSKAKIHKGLLGPQILTFTLRDRYGQVVGFSARDMEFERKKDNFQSLSSAEQRFLAKYRHSSTENAAFNKRSYLYNIDRIKQMAPDKVYVFEGQASVVSAHNARLHNCVAILGGDLLATHIKELQRCGVKHIVLAFDADKNEAGQIKTEKFISEVMSKTSDVTYGILNWINVLDLRKEFNSIDPDLVIQERGVDEFKALPDDSPYKWLIRRARGKKLPSEDQLRSIIAVIATEPSRVYREKLASTLHEEFKDNYSYQAILDDIELEVSIRDKSNIEKQEKIFSSFERSIKRCDDPKQRMDLAAQFSSDMAGTVQVKSATDKISQLEELENIREKARSGEGIPSFTTSIDSFNRAVGGEVEIPGLLAFVVAPPNVGKTAFLQTITVDALRYKDATCKVMWFLNDDTREEFTHRLIAALSDVPIHMVKKEHQYYYNKEAMEKIDKAWNELRGYIYRGQYSIWDSVNELGFIKSVVTSAQQSWNGPIIAFVDSFTRLRNHYSDEQQRLIFSANTMKELSNNGCAMFATAEAVKSETSKGKRYRTRFTNIKGSVAMEYNATLGISLDNPSHRDPDNEMEEYEDTERLWADPEDPSKHRPVVHVHVEKNKRGSWMGSFPLRFNQDKSFMFQAPDIVKEKSAIEDSIEFVSVSAQSIKEDDMEGI